MFDCVRELINAGADVNLADYHTTPLAAAVCHPEVLELLLKAGADPGLHGKGLLSMFGETIFLVAASRGQVQTVRLLLGITRQDLNWRNRSGETALMLAAKAGHVDMVKLLLQSGADSTLRNEEHKTALMLAERSVKLDPSNSGARACTAALREVV